MPTDGPDATAFTAALGALAAPARIHLLRELRTPKALTEITVRAPDDERVLARQTVKQHLDLLVEMGMVIAREAERSRGRTLEYVVNHQALYALGEDVRALARLRPTEDPRGPTQAVTVAAPAPRRSGPRLVLVKGLDEGQVFDLRPPASGRGAWVLGRRRGLAVTLDFDAHVSSENARVTWDGAGYHLEDLPHSRNGTALNFLPLAKGRLYPLEKGDIIGVGRSALVFQA